MPKICGCQISHRQLEICCAPVLAIIREACLAGAETPAYSTIVRLLREAGVKMVPSEMTPVITTLVGRGDIATDGSKYHLAYVLPTGERTVPAPRGTSFANVDHVPRQIMSEEEWQALLGGQRFDDPGQLSGEVPRPIDWQLSARGRSYARSLTGCAAALCAAN
jgi:hypothetical protein